MERMMNGGIQVDLITPNGGVMKYRDSYGLDNTGFTYQEQDSDSWEQSSNGMNSENMIGSEEELIKDVLLVMGEEDSRFGFSFMGGTEEGFPPTVDEMLSGSPADRADLDVGDEIIEVNGNALQNATHTQVISHIQQCVKSRTICLRVKRKKMTEGDPKNQRLKQAYVVANEEQTKAKLNRLVAQKNVQAIDLVTYTNGQEIHIPEINGHVEKEKFDGEQGEPVTEASPSQVNATLEEGVLPNALSLKDSHQEPLIESVQLKRDSTCIAQERLNQLFPEDNLTIDNHLPTDQMVVAVGGDESHLHFSDLETYSIDSSHQSSDRDTSEIVREPSIRQNVITSSNLPAINFDNLFQESRQSSPSQVRIATKESDLITSNNANMAAAVTPGKKTPSKRAPREVAVDCPANFVAASGMKNPPAPHPVGVNGQVTMNGPTMVNGIESIPNNHTNGEAKKVGKPKENNHFKVNNITKNSSHSTNQNTALLQPVSNKPLFEQKSTSAQDYTNNNKPVDVKELFSCLSEIESKLNDNKDRDDIQFLKQLFHNSDFQQALNLHNHVAELHQQEPLLLPEATNAELLAAEIALSTRDVRSPETDALRRIFADPHTKALLHAHDQIATRDPVQHSQHPRHSPVKPGEPEEEDEEEAAAGASAAVIPKQVVPITEGPDRIIRIDKTNNPLGATIINDDEEVIIGRIIKGGMAEKTGLLNEGDRILEINGMDVNGKNVDEISDMLADVNGTITFRVIPAREISTQQPSAASTSGRHMVHVKALFKYDPEDDAYIPCRELGLSFDKGDILHIINQEDGNWWQAHRDGEDEETLAGLIPSNSFQMSREAMKKTLPDDEEPKKGCRCSKNKKKKKKKSPYDAYAEENETEELELYEEVGIYYANQDHKRPIVLVGPPSVGINELKMKLLEDDTIYKAAVPHTSRSKKNHEIDGMDYHFTTKHLFEQDIAAGKFVEYGEFGKNLYGISLQSISSVVNDGRICILNLHPQFLKIIKNSDLHPYYIFIAPPSLDRLRQQRTDAGEQLKEEELRNIIEMGRSMEDVYGHYFDCVIIHYDHERAYRDLTTEVQRIQTEPQWVPIKWIRT